MTIFILSMMVTMFGIGCYAYYKIDKHIRELMTLLGEIIIKQTEFGEATRFGVATSIKYTREVESKLKELVLTKVLTPRPKASN